ncbi:MAG TPA: hypothetical protein VG652_00830 [Gaiellaceae bacterium]|nr:hypothetical protein [Gaiellaceae bacterium]
MGRRALPAVLVLLAAVADSYGAHSLAFDALLGAVPFAAVAALASFGDYLDTRDDAVLGFQSLLWGVAVALLVLSCAMRSASVSGVPPLAISSLVACLVIFAIKTVLALAPWALRLTDLRPAKP